ncbi:MAG: aminoacyl-tRNA hydrolase [Mogibacterium sp.]|nr:aminoacyl-tRNA hydrolase [Mogibacterium sp.]
MGLFSRFKNRPGYAADTYVIAGLGNPGRDYERTRHNMGFRAIDVLSSDEKIDVTRDKFHALIGRGRIDGKKVILVKPQTYMNRSGRAVREAAMYFDVAPQNLIVIYDDIDLPAGSIRIRKSGGAGTHNGMRSVVEELGTTDFVRVRIGIGAVEDGEDLVDRVTGKVPAADQKILDAAAAEAAAAVKDIILYGVDNAMNRHNHVS